MEEKSDRVTSSRPRSVKALRSLWGSYVNRDSLFCGILKSTSDMLLKEGSFGMLGCGERGREM